MKETYYTKTKTALRHVMLAFVLLFSLGANAHSVMDDGHHVDTLSLAERISLHTNAVDWVIGVPNIGVEVDIKARNYNRWSVKGNVRFRPSTSSTFAKPVVYNIFEVSLEGRQYWRERQATPTGIFHFHRRWYEKILSCRSMLPSHPTWVFYRGGYAAYTKYSLLVNKIFGGRQGEAIQAGFTWGFEMPLYQFSNGNSLDLDCGFSAGFAMAKTNKYKVDQVNDAYAVTEQKGWKFNPYPVLKDLHVSFVYRFGKYPIQQRYRWRYDADMQYRSLMDSLYSDSEAKALQKYIADSIYKVVYLDFRHVYDSVIAVRAAEEKAAQIEKTKKQIETLKAESQQLGEDAQFETEPGKGKGDEEENAKKDDEEEEKSEKATEAEDKASEATEVKDENTAEQEQAQVSLARKEDYDEV